MDEVRAEIKGPSAVPDKIYKSSADLLHRKVTWREVGLYMLLQAWRLGGCAPLHPPSECWLVHAVP